jgi:hypothetical protein
MNMPGFSADASLYRTHYSYRATVLYSKSKTGFVQLQQGWLQYSGLWQPLLDALCRAVCNDERAECYLGCAISSDREYCQCTCDNLYDICFAGCSGRPRALLEECRRHRCPIGQAPCGERCCAPGEICVNGACVANPCVPPAVPCINGPLVRCCGPGAYCCGGACCANTGNSYCCIDSSGRPFCCPNNMYCCPTGCQAIPCS